MRKIKNKILSLILFFAMSYSSTGCALFLLGAGAAGAIAISEDEIEGMSDASREKVWRSLREVLRDKGVILSENKEIGTLKALVNNSDVEARIDQITSSTVRLRIKSRKTKGVFPDLKLAQDLYTQVMRKMEGRFPWS